MAEPWAVNPLVPVRLRPVTPKRMHFEASRTRAAEYRPLKPACQGSSPWRRTSITPRGGIGRRTGLRNRSPQGMSVRLGPRGPASSPVAQRQSSALIRRRPVDRAHPGPPSRSAARDHQPPKEVCHETDRRRRHELSRSRANGARASRLRRESSAVIAPCAAARSWPRSSAAMIHARAAPRGCFKHCCLRSGSF